MTGSIGISCGTSANIDRAVSSIIFKNTPKHKYYRNTIKIFITMPHNIVNHPNSSQEDVVGCGGLLAESIAFNRRVVGSTPALVAT